MALWGVWDIEDDGVGPAKGVKSKLRVTAIVQLRSLGAVHLSCTGLCVTFPLWKAPSVLGLRQTPSQFNAPRKRLLLTAHVFLPTPNFLLYPNFASRYATCVA